MIRKRKSRSGLFLKIFLPSILGFLIVVGAVDGYVVNFLTHPKTTTKVNPKLPDDWGKVRALYWEDASWSSQGSSFKGWVLVFGAGAPGIVLTHGYEASRNDLMQLGYRLWERGYNVMICDLRAHGENTAMISTLGALEKDDLAEAVKYFKGLKYNKDTGKLSPVGLPLVDPQNVGLYGVNVSAYAALMVAATDDSIKGVVVDAPSESVPGYVHTRLSQVFGVNAGIARSLVDVGMGLYLPKYDVGSGIDAIKRYKGKKVMVIIGADSPAYKDGANKIFNTVGAANGKLYQPAKSRQTAIYKEDADEYEGAVCDFFRNDAIPPPPPPADGTTGAPGTPGTPAGTPGTPAVTTPPAKK